MLLNHPKGMASDGLTFVNQGVVYTEEGGITDPSVVQLSDGSWFLSYPYQHQVFFATSSDGFSFSKLSSSIAESQLMHAGRLPELTLLEDGSVRLTVGCFATFRSSDGGKSWSEESGIQSIAGQENHSGGGSPSVAREADGSYTLYYVVVVQE